MSGSFPLHLTGRRRLEFEDVLTILNKSKTDTGAVIDGKGKVIGKITMKDAIMAMARPQRSQTGARYK